MVYELEIAASLSEIATELKLIREALEAKNQNDVELLDWVSEIGETHRLINKEERKKRFASTMKEAMDRAGGLY